MPTQTRFLCPSGGANVDLSGIFAELAGGTSYATATKFKVGAVDFTGLFHMSTSSEDQPSFNTGFKITVGAEKKDLSTIFRRRGYVGINITTQPQDQLITNNANTSFTVAATENGNAFAGTYKWRKDGVDLSNGGVFSGVTTATLTVTGATLTNDGSYDCVLTSGGSSVTSNSATLKIKPYITSTTTVPSPLTADDGTAGVKVQCYARGSGNVYFSWFLNGVAVSGQQNQTANLTDGHEYSFTLDASTDGGYTCKVTSSLDATGVTSSSLTATIIAPDITQVKINGSVVTGTVNYDDLDNLVLSLTVSGTNLSYQWYRGATVVSTSSTYSFAVSSVNNGNYYCVVTNGGGSDTSETITVVRYYQNSITVQPVNASVVADGVNDATFTITAIGMAAPTYQWQRNISGWVNLLNTGRVSGATSETLTISDVESADNGAQYRCIVSNKKANGIDNWNNTTSSTVTLNAYYLDITGGSINNIDYLFSIGDQPNYTITTSANPAVNSYVWKKNGTQVSTATSYSFTVDASSAGLYSVDVSNGYLTKSRSSNLYIQPYITTQPTPQTVNTGSQASFTVVAGGSNITYQWQRSTDNGYSWNDVAANGNSATYTTPVTSTSENGYQYRCVISNTLTIPNYPTINKITNQVALTVNYIEITQVVVDEDGVQTAVTQNEETFNVDEGDVVKLIITAAGRPGVAYEWKKWNGTTYVAITGAHISGINSSTLVFNTILESDKNYYACYVNNNQTPPPALLTANTENSREVYLNVAAVLITSQPTTITRTTTQSATFSVTFNTPTSKSYQWKKDGVQISSGTVAAGNGQTLTYTINSVAVSDAGNYTLTIGNTTSSAARLNVSPRIISTGDPAGNYTLYYGSYNSQTLALSVTSADGEATLTYQWYKNDVSLGTSNGANTASFSKTIANGDSGTYKCIVSNSYGTATTGNFVISALSGVPSITSHPQNALVVNNSTATFSVVGSANGATISYQWKKNGSDINGATSSSYTTGALTTANDNDSYTCNIYTNFGSVLSNAASSKIKPYVTSIITSPNPLVFSNGTTPVAVQCYASGSGTLKYSWFKNGVAVTSMQDQNANITGGVGHEYVFTLTESTRGSYTCKVTSNHDSTGITEGPIYAYMTARVASGPNGTTVTAGSNATFTVTAEGTTPLTYVWKKNGTEINGANQTVNSYTLIGASSSNNGDYYSCTVQNTILGTTYSDNSNSALLTVNYAPTNASISGQTSYYVGNQMSFTASVTLGNPTSTTYTWQRSTNNGVSWSQVAQNTTTSSSNQYDPGAATGAMIGHQYRCVISNSIGSVTTSALTLYIIATVTVEPTDTTVNEGGTAVFSLTAEGNSPITYQWYREGGAVGASANAFADSNRQRANNGDEYYCVVSNAGGSDTSAPPRTLTVAYVIEEYIPDGNWYNLPANGEIDLYDGQLQAIRVVAQNYNSNSYQWQKWNGSSWSDVSGAQGNELVWNPISTAEAGTYRCRVSNSLNGSPMYSRSFIITVI